ncbi:MAG: pitrilysin family protein [Planctomycetota bacterium]|nr:pitrilysin family protein [Planctomycetota bacterium]
MSEIVQNIQYHTFGNGLTLIAETMPWLESAAVAISVPGGCQVDPVGKVGLGNFVCEMVQRGCANRSSRQYIEDLEKLGTEISSSVSISHTNFGAAMPAQSLPAALEIVSEMIQDPHLPKTQLEEGRAVCLQEIGSLDDDLGQKTMLELRRRRYPEPYGRSSVGTHESVESMTIEDVTSYFQSFYQPNGAIVSVAGKVEFESVRDHLAKLFDDWQPVATETIQETPAQKGNFHIAHDSNQTHIGLAFPGVAYSDPDYFLARGAVGILSDGMSSRLFTEVREKRGLCYTVYAAVHSLKDRGSVVVYAGTSADRAQETLDVTVNELNRLGQGVTQEELDRLKISIRSSLVMQQESSRSRAASIVGDFYHLGKVRTLDELTAIINGLTVDRINDYVASHPPREFNLVTLGPHSLEEPSGVSTASA